jgi:hypothetical protein
MRAGSAAAAEPAVPSVTRNQRPATTAAEIAAITRIRGTLSCAAAAAASRSVSSRNETIATDTAEADRQTTAAATTTRAAADWNTRGCIAAPTTPDTTSRAPITTQTW